MDYDYDQLDWLNPKDFDPFVSIKESEIIALTNRAFIFGFCTSTVLACVAFVLVMVLSE